MAKLHIGLSGYDYKEWNGEGLFYPSSVKPSGFLKHYSLQFNSLESNGSFTKIPSEATVKKWIRSTPDEFTVSPKMYQGVSHFKRLNEVAIEIARDFVNTLDPLKNADKLGPILVQLPHNMKVDDAKLSTFLKAMSKFRGYRWAFEFLNESWNTPKVVKILEKHNVAVVVSDSEKVLSQPRNPANFEYIRLRRLTYTDDQLEAWAETIRKHMADGKDCFVYCRHKDTESPWKWGEQLRELVG